MSFKHRFDQKNTESKICKIEFKTEKRKCKIITSEGNLMYKKIKKSKNLLLKKCSPSFEIKFTQKIRYKTGIKLKSFLIILSFTQQTKILRKIKFETSTCEHYKGKHCNKLTTTSQTIFSPTQKSSAVINKICDKSSGF